MRDRIDVELFERVGVIPPQRIHIKNHPLGTPTTAFNPGLTFDGENFHIYPRIVAGYYMYVSAIAHIEVPLYDMESGIVNFSHYPADLVVCPTGPFDIWGAEDPRVNFVGSREVMVYTGRTINYFDPSKRSWRTSPIIAVRDGYGFRKIGMMRKDLENIISDKDAFVVEADGSVYLFHRPHVNVNGKEEFYMSISKIENWEELNEISDEPLGSCGGGTPKEMKLSKDIFKMYPAKWEERIGWGPPPIEVEPNTFLALVHAMDGIDKAYKAFLLMFKIKGDTVEVIGESPGYVLTPTLTYEIYGDRPLVTFPTGMVLVDGTVYITYGAADAVIGIARADLSALMAVIKYL
ncbi:hypothetical protein IPA_09750 [Ignicoccus pacificus DSM 13166]|uniref:Glycosidase n=1 Tax=Ignicoccus pacificus DSM 13166 TaxID=940294 RepID=A0A977PKJ7_9CREN|nr:hypothetical protein IPA_09750 [Ignicoccus pacificus DSM 13166]